MADVKRVVIGTVAGVVEETAPAPSFNLFAGCRPDMPFAQIARHDECGAADVHLSEHRAVLQACDSGSA